MAADRRWDLAKVAVAVWVSLALGLAVFSYLYPWSHTVYNIYARACRRWWDGQDIYCAQSTEYYRYSPLFAVGMTPFALFPDSWGGALWRVFSAAVFAAGLWAWARRVVPAACTRAQTAALFLLVLPVSAQSMYNGQANVVMLGVMLLGLAAAAQQRWSRAAVWLALATLIKGYPLALALLLSAVYPRRLPLRFVAALALGLLLPFATHWPAVVLGQYENWFNHLRESTTIMRERLRSLDHLLVLYGSPISPQRFLLIELLAGLGVLGLCLLHARQTTDRLQQLTRFFQLFSVWVVLFGPATETCTYAILAPALAWALIDAFGRPVSWGRRVTLVVSLLLTGPCVTDFLGSTVRNFANEHGSQPVGALLFAGYLVARNGRSKPPARRGVLTAAPPKGSPCFVRSK
jgi:hypothetical protein